MSYLEAIEFKKKANDKSNSPFVSAFWLCKAAQMYCKDQKISNSNWKQKLEEICLKLQIFETSLSPKVKNLITLNNVNPTQVLENGQINWDKWKQTIESLGDDRLLPKVQELAEECHQHLLKLSPKEFMDQYRSYFSLGHSEEIWYNVFLELNSAPLTCFTKVVSWLERAFLASIYGYNIKKPNRDLSSITKKLTEIFCLPEMTKIIEPHQLKLLLVFVGPITGLNIRNLALHGFICDKEEIHPQYSSLVLIMTLSFAQILSPWIQKATNLEKLTNFKSYSPLLKKSGDFSIPCLDDKEWNSICNVMKRSAFILPRTYPMWEKSLNYFKDKDAYSCLITLFPLFEHSIRRIFVAANNCPERRFTAETEVLYTTLDILLSPYTTREKLIQDRAIGTQNIPSKERNEIFSEIEPNAMNALFDLFIWSGDATDAISDTNTKSKFRPRDRIAHGGVIPNEIPLDIAEYVISIAFYFIVKYDPLLIEDDFNDDLKILQKSYHFVKNYKPVFHPKIIIYNQMVNLKDTWNQFINRVILDVVIMPKRVDDPNEKKEVKPPPSEDVIKKEEEKKNKEAVLTQKVSTESDRISLLIEKYSSFLEKKFKYNSMWKPLNADLKNTYPPYNIANSEMSPNDIIMMNTVAVVIKYIQLFMEEIVLQYENLKNMVVTRTAWKRNRENFSELQSIKRLFSVSICLVLSILEIVMCCCSLDKDQLEERELLTNCWRIGGCLVSASKVNKWKYIMDVFLCFSTEEIPQRNLCPLLSKRELITFQGNLKNLFDNIQKKY